jgi:ABC-type transporter Mla MlaB component
MSEPTNPRPDLCQVHKDGLATVATGFDRAYDPVTDSSARPRMPNRPDFAVAIRSGEHACCRFAHSDDRRRLALAFVRAALDKNHRVLHLGDEDDLSGFLADLAAADDRVDGALRRGQLEVRPAPEAYVPDGTFDPARTGDVLRDEHARATADGYAGLSVSADMSWALAHASGLDQLMTYEREITTITKPDVTFLCIYDHGRFEAGTLHTLAEPHQVDVSPELAQVGRVGYLAASRVLPGPTLRLTGQLDFGCAEVLAGVLDAHYHGNLRLDLADLGYVDVTGLRALRGKKGQRLTITSASQQVRKLLGLLGWDTDPEIEIAPAA